MKQHKIGIIMNGVTGRMGTNQHLIRSILAIIKQGGIKTDSGDLIMPFPVLLGRNEKKLSTLAEKHGVQEWSTDLDACLNRQDCQVYFDAQTTALRFEAVSRAMRAGKAVYCEKPIAENLNDAISLSREATNAGIKNGVVQDKLWLPGLLKLKSLIDAGFFGKILSVRGEFGYWVFDGRNVSCQRPSWNYRKEDGGGIVVDMLCHWRYVIDNLFGQVSAVSCLTATHIPERIDETGKAYACTADDAAYATFRLDNGIICHFNSSWSTRVRRDDLLTIQVDGTEGSAVAGLTKCWTQAIKETPRLVWNPDEENSLEHRDSWQAFNQGETYENAFKAQWVLFLKHVVEDTPFPWTLLDSAKGIQLAEKALESHRQKSWMEVEALS